MKKRLNKSLAMVMVVGVMLLNVQPALPRAASADDLSFPTPPPPGELPAEVQEARVRQEAQAVLDKYAQHYGARYDMAITEVKVEGEWAYAVAEAGGTEGESLTLLAHQGTDGAWQALMPGEEGVYLRWIDEVPESLVPAGGKSQLRTQAAESTPIPSHPETVSSVTWSVEGDHSVIYAITHEGTRVKVVDVPFDKMLLPQFSVFITLSPDGQRVTYATADDLAMRNAQLWLIDLDSNSRHLLATFPNDLWIAPLVWSPDGTRIAFTKVTTPSLTSSGIELWMIDVESGGQTLLVSDPSLRPELFRIGSLPVLHWSTDGTNITYTDYTVGDGFRTEYEVNLASGVIRPSRYPLDAVEQSQLSILATLPCGVTQFSQNDPEWRNDVMQTCGQTIGAAGCAVTSVAMTFRYYAVETSPRTLNQCLGNSACPIYWGTAASNCSGGKASYLGSPGFAWSTIESNLSAGRPVIVELNGGNGHYVVAVSGSGSSGSGYTINDPWDGQVKSLAAYTGNGWTPTGLRIYGGTPWCHGGTCSAPSLIEPSDGAVLSSNTVTFRWNAVSGCTFDGYTFRVCTSPDVDNLGNCFIDTGESGTQRIETINGHDNQDLYWGVRAANAPNGANWAVRHFRIEPGSPPPSGNWEARYDQGSTLWWDPNAQITPRCTEDIDGPELHKDWGSNAPCGGMSGDDWVGDFNTTINFPAGEYVFYLEHDDGAKLWLNGQNIQDRGGSGSGPVCDGTGGYYLSGDENLRILLREQGGDARIHLTWSTDTSVCAPQDKAEFVGQSPFPTVEAGQQFTIYFEVRNTGTTTWRDADGYGLENINGQTLGAWERQEIGGDVPPGTTKRWDIQMTAPSTPGVYRTQWMLCHYGAYFGPNMYIDVTVTGGPASDITVSASPDPVTMDAGDFQAITYTFVEHAGTSAHITSREAIFETPSGTPVSDVIGPYGNDIDVPANGSASWVDNVYLPPAVVLNALELGVSSVVLYTTYYGNDQYGQQVSTQAELWIDLVTSCSDDHEFNNTLAHATAIAYGQTLNADICPNGDYDFYTFTGATGDKIVIDIDAASEGSSLDPYIYLLSDSGAVLAENDDEITGQVLDSHLGYHLTYDGTYYIKVRAWDHPNAGGSDHFYDIHLLTDGTDPSQAEVTSPISDSWLDGDLQAIDVIASDGESGVNRVEFLWHDGDWENSEWIWLGVDRDDRDGWSLDWDTSAIPEQSGMAVYVWAFDWVGNWTGAGAYSLGADRTSPTVVVNVAPMYDDAPFRDFHVRWWDSYDNLSGIISYDVQYRDGPSGTWTDLVIGTTDLSNHFVGEDQHTYYFRARARDNAHNQSTYASGDGDAQYTVDICDIAPDGYEADNAASSAQWIATDGTAQTHNVHAEGDEDWVKFYAAAGVTYTLATSNTGGHADTVLDLYRTDGSTLIDSNDDYPGMWPASRLDWQPSASGTYYAKIYHYDSWAYGCTTGYGLTILTNDETSPTGSVSINNGATYADSTATTLDLAGTDTGTGVWQVMLSNNSGFTSATWTDYTASLDWTLTAGDGTKTVYVKFRDRAGNVSGVYSDDIVLDTTAPTGSILIQGGAAVVTQTQVTLTLTASDAHGVTHMRLRNGTAAWGVWEPFAASRTWTLPAQEGQRVVQVQFRDPAGNVSVTYSDSIVYRFPHHVYLPLTTRDG